MRPLTAMVVLAGTFSGLVSSLGPAKADTDYDRCVAAAKFESLALAACGDELVTRAQVELDARWAEVLDRTPERSKYALAAGQLAWTAFKDRACDFFASGDWGREGVTVHQPRCKARLIEERIKQLEDIEAASLR